MKILELDHDRARKVFGSRGATALEMRVVLLFKSPNCPERIIRKEFEQTLGDGQTTTADVAEVINNLIKEAVLVSVADQSAAIFASELSSLGRLLDDLAGDLTAMGDWAQRHISVADEAPTALLSDVRAKLSALQQALHNAQPSFIEEQHKASPKKPEGPLCLHLGCGESRASDWLNIDMLGGDFRMNLAWKLPFADCSVRYVYSAHTFEHLDFHTTGPRLLREIHRTLEPGGVLRLAVPDIGNFNREYVAKNRSFFEQYDRQRPEFAGAAGYHTPLAKIMRYAGSAVRPGSFFEHKMGYDYKTLKALLKASGFSAVEESSYLASDHDRLRKIDEHCGPAKFTYEHVSNTLFVEATK